MRTSRLVRTCVVALALCSSAAPADEQSVTQPDRLFLVEFTTGTAWVPDKPFGEQLHAAEHSANLRRLREAGILVLGARHGAKGMVVVRSSSESAARSEIERDLAVAAGVFAYTVEELRPFYDGCIDMATSR